MKKNSNYDHNIKSEELHDLLEDVLTQIQELRAEFTSAIDDIEDMLTSV
jgi:hypothetical protein